MLASRGIKIKHPRTPHQGSGQVCRPPLASSFPAANEASISSFPAAFLPGSGRYQATAVRRAACPKNLRRYRLLQDAYSASICRGTACCANFSVACSTTVERAIQKRPLALGFCFRFSPNCDNLNRQTREFRNAVTYRKQTAVNCSNRQNIQKWSSLFFAASPPPPV